MDEKTGAQLDDHEVRTYLEFAGERAYVSKDEMASHGDYWHMRLGGDGGGKGWGGEVGGRGKG